MHWTPKGLTGSESGEGVGMRGWVWGGVGFWSVGGEGGQSKEGGGGRG